MAKKRIHQIAKELDIASADILHQAKELGIEVKTASSGLTEEEEELVKLALAPTEEEKEVEVAEEVKEVAEEVKEEPLDDKEEHVENEETDDEVQIVEVSRNSSAQKLSPLIDIDATQIVGDLWDWEL